MSISKGKKAGDLRAPQSYSWNLGSTYVVTCDGERWVGVITQSFKFHIRNVQKLYLVWLCLTITLFDSIESLSGKQGRHYYPSFSFFSFLFLWNKKIKDQKN